MNPFLRKFALTTHIICSVGWFGAVAGFLALAIAGLTSENAQLVQAVCIAMELVAWFVIVPFALASLLTGLVSSLATKWGLFRYYWVLAKLLITIFATLILLVHLQPISHLADVATKATLFNNDLKKLQVQMVVDAGAALLVLIVTTILAVYKPRGITRYGQRKQLAQRREAQA